MVKLVLLYIMKLFWQIDSNPKTAEEQVNKLRKDRGYTYQDMITCSRDKLPNYEEKVNNNYRVIYRIRPVLNLSLTMSVKGAKIKQEWIFPFIQWMNHAQFPFCHPRWPRNYDWLLSVLSNLYKFRFIRYLYLTEHSN